MSRVLNGSSQYLDASSTLLSNEPIGMFCWFNPNTITTLYDPITICNNGTNGYYALLARGATAGDPVTASKNNDAGTGSVNADSAAGFSASAWNAGGVSFSSDTSRAAYLNGANKGTDTTSRADPTPDFITIGALHTSTGFSGYFGGSLAECYLFDVAPTDAQHAALALGINALDAGIPGANIRGWYPLIASDNNHMANGYPNLTPVGSPTLGSHPAQPIYPRIGGLISM